MFMTITEKFLDEDPPHYTHLLCSIIRRVEKSLKINTRHTACYLWGTGFPKRYFYEEIEINQFLGDYMVYMQRVFNYDRIGTFKGKRMYRFKYIYGNYEEVIRSRYIPYSVKKQVLYNCGYKCCICDTGRRLEIDHIYPFSKGGSNDISNLQVLCKTCNLKKRDKLL